MTNRPTEGRVENRPSLAIHEEDPRMRLAQQGAGVGSFDWDILHDCFVSSAEMERLFGLPRGGFVRSHKTILACVHPADRAEAERQWQQALAAEHMEGDWRVIWPDGTIRWVSARATVEKDRDGVPVRMLGVTIDITNRKFAEEALRRSEALYHTIARSIPDAAMSVVDWNLRYLTVEGELLPRLGLSKESMEGRKVQEALDGETGQVRVEHFRRALAGESSSYETEYRGRIIWSQFVPLRDESGHVLAAMSLGLDITERKKAEAAMREHAQLAQLRADATQALQRPAAMRELLQEFVAFLVERLDAAFARVWTLDKTGKTLELQASAGLYTHLNGAHSRVPVGRLKIGRIALDRQPLATNQVVGDPLVPDQEWALREGLVAFAGYPLILDGRLLGVVALFARHALSPGAVESISVLSSTLAQAMGRKQAQESLLSEKEFSDTAINSLPGVFYLFDAQNRLRRWNKNFEVVSGYSTEEIGRMVGPDFVATEEHPMVAQAIAKVFATGEGTVEFHLLTKIGKKIPYFFTGIRLDFGGQTGFLGVGLDITERKEADARVAALNQRLAADLADMSRLHEVSTCFVRQGDLRTLLEAILDAAIAITGADKGDIRLLDAISGELGITVQRGFDSTFEEFYNRIRTGIAACGTAIKARQCVVVEDIAVSPLFLAEPRALELKLAAGVRAVTCAPLLTRPGQLVGVLSVHFNAPHRPSERDLRLLDLLARQAADSIERTQAENALREARDQLALANAELEHQVQRRTARLRETIEELEGFSYSITHDMRAPLRAMQTFATLAEEECAGDVGPKTKDYFRRVKTASQRLDRLIQDALSYSKVVREHLALARVDVAKLLRDMIETYPNLQPSAADITVEFDHLLLLGNESALTQVFSNLLSNAVKFVAPGVKPGIRIRAENRQPSAANFRPSASPSVRIWIEDNGIGVPKEAHEKIFDMFQRMHREDKYPGTGIGLALVRKAVKRMGGQVGLESEPGKGSRFWIELPEVIESPKAVDVENPA